MGNDHSTKSGERHYNRTESGKSEKEIYVSHLFGKLASDKGSVDESSFNDIFSVGQNTSSIAKRLYAKYNGDGIGVTERRWMDESLVILGLMSEVQYLVNIYSDDGEVMSRENMEDLLLTSCVCSHLLNNTSPPSCEDLVMAVAKSLLKEEVKISNSRVCQWVNTTCPKVLAAVHTFLLHVLTGKQTVASPPPPHHLDVLLTSPISWLLSSILPSLYITSHTNQLHHESPTSQSPTHKVEHMCDWDLLYHGSHHGFSMNRFEHHTFSYKSPTVSLISVGSNLYCAAADVEWREHPKQWGGHNCSIWQILPEFKELEHGSNIFYYNIKSRGLTNGIKLGSDLQSPLLYIDSDMNKVNGRLLLHSGKDHILQAIEVWGCGDRSALSSQSDMRVWEKQQVERAQRGPKQVGNWQENPDRLLLDLAGRRVEHNERPDT